MIDEFGLPSADSPKAWAVTRAFGTKLGPESILSPDASAARSLHGPSPECMGESVFRSGRGKRLRGSHPTQPSAPAQPVLADLPEGKSANKEVKCGVAGDE